MGVIIPGDFPSPSIDIVFFYKLSDPMTGEVCYIGQTNNPWERYEQHCGRPGYFTGNIDKDFWISNLVFKHAKTPIMEVIEFMPCSYYSKSERSDALKREYKIINEYRKNGHPLLNKMPRMKWYERPGFENSLKNSLFWKRVLSERNAPHLGA